LTSTKKFVTVCTGGFVTNVQHIAYSFIPPGETHIHSDDIRRAARELLPYLLDRQLTAQEVEAATHIPDHAMTCIAWRRANANVDTFQQPVGIAFLYLCDRPWKREGKIEDVVVHPSARSQGIGRGLMERLIQEAKVYGITSLQLTSAPKREAANALYLTLGFECAKTNVYRMKF